MVAFIDDDCRPDAGWLAALLEAASENTFLQGRTAPDPEEFHLLGGLARSLYVDAAGGWYPTCNIAYRNDLLEELGGFDEVFPGAFGEDTDLALRARAAGAEPEFVPEAIVWHAVHPRTLRAAIRDAGRSEVIPFVLKRHPEQRRELVWSLFFTWRHARLSLAAAGALVARRRPVLALAAALPYVERNVEWRHSPARLARTLAAVPFRAVADGAEILAVVRAALRHRVPVV